MRVSRHVSISAAFSVLVYTGTGSAAATAASFLAGWLIDVDHLLDYAVEHGLRPDIRYFFDSFASDNYHRARLPLHGWEWCLACAAGAIFFPGHAMIFWGAAFGLLQHLALDQLSNGPAPLGYSLLWRASKDFNYRRCFPD